MDRDFADIDSDFLHPRELSCDLSFSYAEFGSGHCPPPGLPGTQKITLAHG